MHRIRLIPEDEEVLHALHSPDEFKNRYGADVSRHQQAVKEVVQQSLEFYKRVVATKPWIGYLTVDAETNLVIGCCGFKGSPASGGEVELAYHTFSDYEGSGFATAMAHELVRIAREESTVSRIVAHTLPESNASTRILEKVGFRHSGEANDDEVGLAWHWRLDLR